MSKILYCDGWSNPTNSGWLVCDMEDKYVIDYHLPEFWTNNEAEYNAMLNALKMADEQDTIYTDSRLVWGQLMQGWKVRAQHLKKIIQDCKELIYDKSIEILWIPRSENKAGILIEKFQKEGKI